MKKRSLQGVNEYFSRCLQRRYAERNSFTNSFLDSILSPSLVRTQCFYHFGQNMIILFTDFGIGSPYQAQLFASLHQHGADSAIINLHSDLTNYHIQTAAYLLSAYIRYFPLQSVFVCVVDPGVGSQRLPIVVQCQDRWFVGPDNGLFEVLKQHFSTRFWKITWKPEKLSKTFHGRDLFAPVAARLSQGDLTGLEEIGAEQLVVVDGHPWPDDLWQIIYLDHYGNAYTGVRAEQLAQHQQLQIHGQTLSFAATYSDVPIGQGFWYENSIGLVELAINQGNAAQTWGIKVGDVVNVTH